MSGRILQVQKDLVAYVQASDFFRDIFILTEDKKEIEYEVDQVVAQAGGLAIALLMPTGGGLNANLVNPLLSIDVIWSVVENVVINDAGPHALDCVEELIKVCHSWQGDDWVKPLSLKDPGWSMQQDKKLIGYNVNFETEICLESLADLKTYQL